MANNATIAANNAVQNAEYADIDFVYKRQVRYTIANGGGTFTVNGYLEHTPESGSMVGGLIDSLVIDPRGLSTESDIAQIFMQYQARIPQTISGSVYFGSWIDPETGLWHLDASEHYDDIVEAVHVARKRGELAIWDIDVNDEIRVK